MFDFITGMSLEFTLAATLRNSGISEGSTVYSQRAGERTIRPAKAKPRNITGIVGYRIVPWTIDYSHHHRHRHSPLFNQKARQTVSICNDGCSVSDEVQ